MNFAIIENNTIVNVIVAETLLIAEEVANGLKVQEIETLKNQAAILNDKDPNNSFLVIPNIGMLWFRNSETDKWFAPKPEGNYNWSELDQLWIEQE